MASQVKMSFWGHQLHHWVHRPLIPMTVVKSVKCPSTKLVNMVCSIITGRKTDQGIEEQWWKVTYKNTDASVPVHTSER